jgi:hypothetical protein
MEAEQFRGITDAAFRALQGTGDEHLLELAPRIVIEDALAEHLLDERFELIAHGF